MRTIMKAKILHWKHCLDETRKGKMWKATIYMRWQDPRGSSCPQSRRSSADRQPGECRCVYCYVVLALRVFVEEESLALPVAELPIDDSRSQRSKSIVSASEIWKRLDRTRRRRSSDSDLEMVVPRGTLETSPLGGSSRHQSMSSAFKSFVSGLI